ncbi:SMP-30/gluconolactonase/LRE family protein [Dyadobacter helix]|nr:SMP-30/gluconolactonase/LRE family protein [Dyadobacter sp. CECT 9275]
MVSFSVTKLLDLPFYTEGPATDVEGNYYFTGLTGGFIGKVDANGIYSKWADGTCPNGQVVLPNGEHWFCDSRLASISCYNSAGNFKGHLLSGKCAGVGIGAPNDLILDENQNLYFTDSIRTEGKVFFKGTDGTERLVATNIDYANGLVLSKDERYLFVAESYQNRILVMELKEPGIAKGKAEVFAELPRHSSGNRTDNLPDGLALDHQGNLWVAHYGMQAVQVLDPGGELLFSIDTTLPLTSNICFVEDNASVRKLLITGGYGEPGPGAVLLLNVYN